MKNAGIRASTLASVGRRSFQGGDGGPIRSGQRDSFDVGRFVDATAHDRPDDPEPLLPGDDDAHALERHLLSVPRLQCEKATCFPVRDRSGRTPLLQAEVEVVAKFVSPGEWHNVCRGHNRTYLGECVTTEDEPVTLRGPS